MTFSQQFWGAFQGILKWSQLDELWQSVQKQPQGWYLYQPYQALPQQPLTESELHDTIAYLDRLLREKHPYDYCGIVYADSVQVPTLIKVFNPNHLGASCGSSGEKVLPEWILSQFVPEALELPPPAPSKWRRWWSRIS